MSHPHPLPGHHGALRPAGVRRPALPTSPAASLPSEAPGVVGMVVGSLVIFGGLVLMVLPLLLFLLGGGGGVDTQDEFAQTLSRTGGTVALVGVAVLALGAILRVRVTLARRRFRQRVPRVV